MITATRNYFAELSDRFAQGWTRFWFTPTDPATLCAMRLLIGLVVVYLHASLTPDLVTLFGREGLLPVAEIAPLEAGNFSYLNYLSRPSDLWIAHFAGLAILGLFTAGLWTRVTTVLALVVLLSDINRAPMLSGRADQVAAMIMFYLCFAPAGRRYSLDSWLKRRAADRVYDDETLFTTATIATRLIQVHLALLVAMMGFSKLTGDAWWTGQAMWWLIARQESRWVDLTGLHAAPKLIDLWTHAIVLFELVFPVVIWVPLARPLLIAAGIVIWSSLVLVTGDVPFALTMIIASMAFVSPTWVRSIIGRQAPPAVAVA
jgi:hypothetical protein